ncbi:PDR/VanB family oxidoreductase [Amycolatopsis rhabdoformis]|uniref:PDR/VanB family oxidoreductase n=1 Tax=Amycolatopsis rhabdoformis TaxID=1448059 RepID=A0ABZ1IMT7_9PSEU|nr:PDR/VanB family oxidoreductase [Amycolatopsis rhabdoformis]WSE34735.1 PDR/VanB family oxidoreductase [Amycolatopsis rhabdoformis]
MAEFEMTVAGRRSVADGVVELVLRARPGEALPGWTAGAHIDLRLDPATVRQYSLCGPADDPSTYRIAVLREETGRGGSRRVHDEVHPGQTVVVGGPRNNFEFEKAPAYLFIAGGIGITPLLPMIEQAGREGADWKLAYGGRSRSTMAYLDELRSRESAPGRVQAVPFDECGLLDLPALIAELPPEALIYCCGPEPLLAAVELATAGLAPGTLHVERFSAREIDAGEDLPFTVELAASGRTLEVPAERSLLDVLLEHGVDVLTSCEEGTCGTCETPVLAGEPDHRDSILTADEQAANDRMLVCVSRCRSARLVLDL